MENDGDFEAILESLAISVEEGIQASEYEAKEQHRRFRLKNDPMNITPESGPIDPELLDDEPEEE